MHFMSKAGSQNVLRRNHPYVVVKHHLHNSALLFQIITALHPHNHIQPIQLHVIIVVYLATNLPIVGKRGVTKVV